MPTTTKLSRSSCPDSDATYPNKATFPQLEYLGLTEPLGKGVIVSVVLNHPKGVNVQGPIETYWRCDNLQIDMNSVLPKIRIFLLVFMVQPTSSLAREGTHSICLNIGWWSVETEYSAPFGFFVGIGVPWYGFVLDDLESAIPVMANLGYQIEPLQNFTLRTGIRLAIFGKGSRDYCLMCSDEELTIALLELGYRYEHPCGLIVGIDLPIVGLKHFHRLFASADSQYSLDAESVLFPITFSHVYLGYILKF